MASDTNRPLDIPTDPFPEAPSSGVAGGAEFFDRERWHDVESDEECGNSPTKETNATFSTFSAAILLLIAVMAGGIGIIVAHMIPLLINTDIPPLQRDYTNTPALWVRYTENSAFFCDLSEPCCFTASRAGRLFIGNANPPAIHVYSLQGKAEAVFPVEAEPQAIAFGEPGQAFEGKLLLAHKDKIGVYTPAGKLEKTLKLPNEKSSVWSLALGGTDLFAADSGNRLIHRFNAESGEATSFGQQSHGGFGGFVVYLAPISITVSQKTGLLHVANPGRHRIETFSVEGHWEPSLSWQGDSASVTSFAGCCNPVGLDTLHDGRIVTSEKDVTRVKVYKPDGRLDCVVAGPEILGKKPRNIPQLEEMTSSSEDEKRAVFVAALENDHVVVFDPLWRIARLFTPNAE